MQVLKKTRECFPHNQRSYSGYMIGSILHKVFCVLLKREIVSFVIVLIHVNDVVFRVLKINFLEKVF